MGSLLVDPVVIAIAAALVGLVVGVLSGLLGIGGGTILVPTFKLGFLMDAIACTATSMFTIIPTSIAGAVSHVRNRTCIPQLGVAAGLGGALTAPLGVWLASLSPDWAIMAAAAVVIGYSAFTMLSKAIKMPKEKEKAAKGATKAGEVRRAKTPTCHPEEAGQADEGSFLDPVNVAPERPALTRKQLAIGAVIGLVAGVMSGYVGVGGGFLMVPLMIQILNMPMKLTSGTSLIAVLILATSGTVYQAYLGNVNWIAGIFVACGSIPGALLGSRLVSRVPERTLRFVFSAFLMVAAALLVVDQISLV